MKRSISWIMVICLSSVLMFSSFANAASISPSYDGASTMYLNLIDSYVPPIDSTDNPMGNYVVATYKAYYNSRVSFSGTDGYTSGYVSYTIDFTPSVGSADPRGVSIINNLSLSNISCKSSPIGISSCRLYGTGYFDNIWDTSVYPIVDAEIIFSCYFTYTGSNVPDPPSYIPCTVSASVSGSLTKMPEPQDMGFAHIISSAINNGDFSGNVEQLVDLLTLIKDNNATYYTNILAALNTENGWLEEIFTQLDNWDQIWWPAIYAENQTQSSRLSTVLSNLQTIISDLVLIDSNNVTWLTRLYNKVTDIYNYMQQSDQGATQAANAADQAAAQASQIAAVPRPNANAIINEGVSRIDTDISSGFSVLGAILNQQWYIWLLMIVISLAFVSYLMYGKGV